MATTGTVAVLLSYLKTFEPRHFVSGVLVVAIILALGASWVLVYRGRWRVVYWALLGAITAFLCAVGEPLTHESFHYAWPVVGACCAGSTILLEKYPLGLRMACGAFIGFAVLAIWSAYPIRLGVMNTWMEVVCGPVAGAIMVGVVWVLETLREWRRYSLSVLVLVLCVGVVGGNVFGRWIGWL